MYTTQEESIQIVHSTVIIYITITLTRPYEHKETEK
jgi:hypothetical protein